MRSHYPVKGIIIAICLLILMAFAQIALAGGEAEPASYAAGDIQFCPKGKPYLHTSCSPVRTSMATAISDAQTAAASGISGTIYLESGSYGGTINFSGFTYGTSLIVQGGVDSGTTTFTRAMYLSGNDLDFTLRMLPSHMQLQAKWGCILQGIREI